MRDLHEEFVKKLNRDVHGTITSKKFNGVEGYKPDIIQGGVEYELELFGRPNDLLRYKFKFSHKRFDNKKHSTRVLIVAINPKYKKYFDEIYVTKLNGGKLKYLSIA